MPFREKIAWLSLVALAVAYIPYFVVVASGTHDNAPAPNFPLLILLAGAPMKGLGMLAGGGVALLTAAYFLYDNARHRIDAFLGGGTAFDQVDLASRTLSAGGWLGAGYGLGIRKMTLPEAHTD